MSFISSVRKFQQTKMMGFVRVTAYGMFVMLCVGTCAARQAKADVTEQTFVLGRDLSKVADLLDHTYQVRLNGETIFMSQSEVALPMKDVLDRFEEHCNENPGVLADPAAWKDLPRSTVRGKGDSAGLVARLGVARKETKNEGMVGCLTKSSGMSPTLGEAFKTFIRTGELGSIGKLRYVYVKGPSPSGRMSITMLWTEDNFNLTKIMPPQDALDAPGTDSPTAGRPPSAQRIMTAEIVGTPYALRIYESGATPDMVYGKFDATMASDDWLAYTGEGQGGHVYFKDGVEMTLQAAWDKDSGKTVVTIGELGGDQLRGQQ